jgi:hypothetical protein
MSQEVALPDHPSLVLEGRRGVPADRIVVVSPVGAALAPTYLSPGSKGMPSTAAIAFLTGGLGIAVTRTALRTTMPILKDLRRLKRGGFEVFPVSRTDLDAIQFPTSHPRENVVYARHPFVGTRYYPLSTFHRFVFEHKTREAIKLLVALGAESVEVEHRTGWSKKFAGSLDLPMGKGGGSRGASGKSSLEGHKTAQRDIVFRATLEGNDEPHVPPELVWLPHEPLWQEVADLRIRKGLREFTLDLVYDDDFGVNAKLEAAISKKGRLEIAGSFESQVNTKWTLSGRFRSSTAGAGAARRHVTARAAREALETAMLEIPKTDLYRRATELQIAGRSEMSKPALARAIVARDAGTLGA